MLFISFGNFSAVFGVPRKIIDKILALSISLIFSISCIGVAGGQYLHPKVGFPRKLKEPKNRLSRYGACRPHLKITLLNRKSNFSS